MITKCSFQLALRPSSAEGTLYFIFSLDSLHSSDVYRHESGRCHTLPFFLTFLSFITINNSRHKSHWGPRTALHLLKKLKSCLRVILEIRRDIVHESCEQCHHTFLLLTTVTHIQQGGQQLSQHSLSLHTELCSWHTRNSCITYNYALQYNLECGKVPKHES